MSLDKGIKHGKEKRREYFRSGRFDPTCRPGGSCPYCQNNRKHSYRKREAASLDQLHDEFDFLHYDPTDVEMDRADELMKRFGFDPNDPKDMVRSGLWYNPNIKLDDDS
jgi:hypothetical protein